MAHIRNRKIGGVYLAMWRDINGKLVEESTGEYNQEKAMLKAVKMETIAKFWECVPHFHTYARLNYSPKFCHETFIAGKHIRLDKFRELLKEAGVEFVSPDQWRDTKKKTSSKGKRWRYNGKSRTAAQIVEESGAGINAQTLRYRLEKGWSMKDALETQPMPPKESGALKGKAR